MGDEQCTDERQAPDAGAFEAHDKSDRRLKLYESLQREKRRATEVCASSGLGSQRDTQFERSATNHETPLERAGAPHDCAPCLSQVEP